MIADPSSGDARAAAATLRRLALNEDAKAAVLSQPALYAPLLRAAMRYIGGEDLPACVGCARRANALGHAVTIDYMGESTRDLAMAEAAAAEFIRVAQHIAAQGLDATLSLDLSHIGLVVDPEVCLENALAIADAVPGHALEMMISAEGVDRTDDVLALYQRLSAAGAPVGITLQAFLPRTVDDLDAVLGLPGKVRIVKGAFDAPAGVALPRGPDLDRAYLALVRRLTAAGHPVSVATHDAALIAHVTADGPLAHVEFEMLRGIEEAALAALHAQGYRTRQYLPYGREWFLYLCNRLAEHPPSLFAAVVAMAPSA